MSSEVQAIGDRIFFTIYNGVRIFPALYPTRHIFFQSRKFFPWVFPCKIFFSRNQSGIPAASGIRERFACGIRKTTKFCFERWNPGLWNPEYSSRNLEFTHDWNPEPKFHYQGIRNAVHGIWKPWRRIQKPRLLPVINTWGDTLIRIKKRTAPLHAALAVHPVIFLFPQTNPSVPGYIDKHIFFQLALSRNAVLNFFFYVTRLEKGASLFRQWPTEKINLAGARVSFGVADQRFSPLQVKRIGYGIFKDGRWSRFAG